MLVGIASPGFLVNYAITGDNWYNIMGSASLATNGSTMIIYYFASLDRHDHDEITNGEEQQRPLSSFKPFFAFINRRENRSLAIDRLCLITSEAPLTIIYRKFLPTIIMAIPHTVGSFYLWFSGSIHPSSTS